MSLQNPMSPGNFPPWYPEEDLKTDSFPSVSVSEKGGDGFHP